MNPRISYWALALALAACAFGADTPPPVAIQLRVINGDNATYSAGSRATSGVSVQVSDESSQPVESATVSFQLPDGGPGGLFAHAKKTEIVKTKSDGVAAVWGMEWNKTPGAFELKVTAVKGTARAGLIIPQLLTEAKQAGGQASGEGVFTAAHHSRGKWLLIGALTAGAGAGAALAFGGAFKATPSVSPAVPLQIGAPTLIIGHP